MKLSTKILATFGIWMLVVVFLFMTFGQEEKKDYKNTAKKEKTLKDDYKQLRQESWKKKQEFKKVVKDTIQ